MKLQMKQQKPFTAANFASIFKRRSLIFCEFVILMRDEMGNFKWTLSKTLVVSLLKELKRGKNL